jgi:hypothetical protein|tara:strand:+ start:40 stop:801 length:762 start_codon:yes stop_codon:yes gene_type:complete
MTKYLKTKEGSIEDVAKQMQNKVMENDYQDKFKKALDKEGKPLGHMTGAEKKAFFNKVDKMHKGKDENAMSVADVDRLKKQGMKKESLGKEDKPVIKKVVDKLKGASQAHAGQAKDLEKAMKTEKRIRPKRLGEELEETHMSTAKKQNAQQRSVGGEKEIIKKESAEWKTFAQLRNEIDEACWDSHKQVGFKMKGGKRVPNCVPKSEEVKEEDKKEDKKEQEAGEDTRDKNKKTMTGKVATSPEMNPKVDYKY